MTRVIRTGAQAKRVDRSARAQTPANKCCHNKVAETHTLTGAAQSFGHAFNHHFDAMKVRGRRQIKLIALLN